MASPDALLSLREAIKNATQITFTDESNKPTDQLSRGLYMVLSPSITFPKSAPTRLRKPGHTATDWIASPSDFYTLHAVYLAWRFKDATTAEYMRSVREAGVSVPSMVAVTEKQNVVDWLEGRIENHENILPLQGSTTPKSPVLANTGLPQANTITPAPQPASAAASGKRRYVPDAKDLEAVKKMKLNEIELKDRNTVLRGTKTGNFINVRNLIAERIDKLREAQKPGTGQGSSKKTDSRAGGQKSRKELPIIVISSSPTSLLTLWNVRRFLEDSVFEESHAAKERATAEGNARAEDVVVVYRKKAYVEASGRESENSVRYFVVDGIEALNKFGTDPWERVICVVTTGQAWQFKPYKWSEPKQLFHHVKGFHVCWTNDPPNPKIKDWNVTDLKIDPTRRHMDKATVAQFWNTLDAWVLTNKPWMAI